MNSTSTCSNAFEYKSIHDCNVHVTKCDNDNLNNNDIIQKSDEKSLIRTIKLQKFSDSIITMETNKRS